MGLCVHRYPQYAHGTIYDRRTKRVRRQLEEGLTLDDINDASDLFVRQAALGVLGFTTALFGLGLHPECRDSTSTRALSQRPAQRPRGAEPWLQKGLRAVLLRIAAGRTLPGLPISPVV